MLFEFMKTPAIFERMKDAVLRDLSFVRVYLDDVFIYSNNMEDELMHFERETIRIASHGLNIKLVKCSVAQPLVKLLGHITDRIGVAMDPEKIKPKQKAPVAIQTSLKEVGSFLGLASYYRRLVPMFAEASDAFHGATSPQMKWLWTSEKKEAFLHLKTKLVRLPFLGFPYFDEPFVYVTDSYSVTHGAVLF